MEADSKTLSKRLSMASAEGNAVLCRQLLAHGADVNADINDLPETHCRCSPMLSALKSGHFGTAKLLIDKGADLHRGACSQEGRVGYQALHYAVWNNDRDFLTWLLSKNPPMSERGVEPVHIAAIQGKTEYLTVLLDHERRRQSGSVRRMLDVQVRCDKDIPRMCLAQGIFTFGLLSTGTSLHLASWQGCEEAVKLLLRYGANVNAVDGKYRTPLHHASQWAHLSVMKLLLDAGASVFSRGCNGCTPLSFVLKGGSLEALDILLNRKSDTQVQDRWGRSCAYLAVMSDSAKLLPKLLELGIDFNIPTHDGDTALHAALSLGTPELIQFAIDHAPVPDLPQENYGGVLNAACALTSGPDVQILLSRAPPKSLAGYVNHFSTQFGTPLYAAAYRGDAIMVEALLEAGSLVDKHGGNLGTAFDAACGMGRREIVIALLRRGATPVSTDPEEPTQPFTSPFESVQDILNRYLEMGVAGLDDPPEAASEQAIADEAAAEVAAEAAVEADAAALSSETFMAIHGASLASSNEPVDTELAPESPETGSDETPHQSLLGSIISSRPDSGHTALTTPECQTTPSQFAISSPNHSLPPETPTPAPRAVKGEHPPLDHRQLSLVGHSPSVSMQKVEVLLVTPSESSETTVSSAETPTLCEPSETSTTSTDPSSIATPEWGAGVPVTGLDTPLGLPSDTATTVHEDPFVTPTKDESKHLGQEDHYPQNTLSGDNLPEAA